MKRKAPERPEEEEASNSEEEAEERSEGEKEDGEGADEDEADVEVEAGAEGEGGPAAEDLGQEPPVPKVSYEPKLLVEGVLFSAGHALQVVEIEQATGLTRRDVTRALRRLQSEYHRRQTAVEVAKVGARWTMQLKSEVTPQARAIAPPEVPARLLKTLALVAYHQPVRQSALMEMVGPKVYDQVKELADMGLVIATPKGSTKVLTTTQRFLEYFGIASARRDYIKRFLAERVGVRLPEPQPDVAPAPEDAPAECAPATAAPVGEAVPAQPPREPAPEDAPPEADRPQG